MNEQCGNEKERSEVKVLEKTNYKEDNSCRKRINPKQSYCLVLSILDFPFATCTLVVIFSTESQCSSFIIPFITRRLHLQSDISHCDSTTLIIIISSSSNRTRNSSGIFMSSSSLSSSHSLSSSSLSLIL